MNSDLPDATPSCGSVPVSCREPKASYVYVASWLSPNSPTRLRTRRPAFVPSLNAEQAVYRCPERGEMSASNKRPAEYHGDPGRSAAAGPCAAEYRSIRSARWTAYRAGADFEQLRPPCTVDARICSRSTRCLRSSAPWNTGLAIKTEC